MSLLDKKKCFLILKNSGLTFFLTLILGITPAKATLLIQDDSSHSIEFKVPPKRVISLAPHITELLFEAGGGDKIVGTVLYSDYPKEAQIIPHVGDSITLNIEKIMALKPDLIIAWKKGQSKSQLEKLRVLKIPIYVSESDSLQSIARSLKKFGQILNTQNVANKAEKKYIYALKELENRYQNKSMVSVYLEIWSNPMMTLNNQHIVSEVITLCGGKNIFGYLRAFVPQVSLEAVIEKNPEAILTMSAAENNNVLPSTFKARWEKWPSIKAVQQQNLFAVKGDWLSRPGPRIIKGAQQVCEDLEKVRKSR